MKLSELLKKYGEQEISEEEFKNQFNLKESKVWKPREDEDYYYIGNGVVEYGCWDGLTYDLQNYSIGNCFKTEDEALFIVQKLKLIAELKRFALEHNTEPIDLKNYDQTKYYFYYDRENDEIVWDVLYTLTNNPFGIYFFDLH